jgi:signal peptidase complex subunit 1
MDALLDRARDIYEGEIVSFSPNNNPNPPPPTNLVLPP